MVLTAEEKKQAKREPGSERPAGGAAGPLPLRSCDYGQAQARPGQASLHSVQPQRLPHPTHSRDAVPSVVPLRQTHRGLE